MHLYAVVIPLNQTLVKIYYDTYIYHKALYLQIGTSLCNMPPNISNTAQSNMIYFLPEAIFPRLFYKKYIYTFVISYEDFFDEITIF